MKAYQVLFKFHASVISSEENPALGGRLFPLAHHLFPGAHRYH